MPNTFGKYELLGELGAGGMAVVYKARDTMLDRIVALKVISHRLQGGEAARRRFLNEARVAAVLNHSNIVAVYELGVEDGFPYIAMEYLAGEDLRDIIEQGVALNIHQKLNIALQIARALEHAHSRGVVHRDIKPGNIRILQSGGVKLMDFGIAKITSAELTRLTRTGAVMGTASYMSPEQLRGEDPSEAADVFSFGIVLYELLTYTKPFDAPHPAAMVYRILNTEPPPLEGEGIPADLKDLVAGCLRKTIEERIPSFSQIVKRLSNIRRGLRQSGGKTDERTDAPLLSELGSGGSEEGPDETEELQESGDRPEMTETFGDVDPTWRYAGQVKEKTGSGPLQLLGPGIGAGAEAGARRQLAAFLGVLLLLGAGVATSLRLGWLDRSAKSGPTVAAVAAVTEVASPAPSPTVLALLPLPAGTATPAPPAETETPTVTATASRIHTPAVSPTLTPTPRPSPTQMPEPSPAPPTRTSEEKAVRLVRVGGAPEGTQICIDGKVTAASRAGVAFILQGVALGKHRMQLWNAEKGTAAKDLEVEAGTEPQVILFKPEEWTAPRFVIHLRSSGKGRASVLEHRRRAAKDKAWTGYAEPKALEAASGDKVKFEGEVEEEYRIELESGRILAVGFQWNGTRFESGELKLENSDGVLSTKRCLPRKSGGECSGVVLLECGTLD